MTLYGSKRIVELKLIYYSCVNGGICIVCLVCLISLFSITVFWDVIPCRPVNRYQSFEGTYYLTM
jgi:hypothetical protein